MFIGLNKVYIDFFDSNFITSVTKDLILLISGISGRLGKAGILGNLGRLGTLHPFLKYLINPRNIMKFTFDFLNDSNVKDIKLESNKTKKGHKSSVNRIQITVKIVRKV